MRRHGTFRSVMMWLPRMLLLVATPAVSQVVGDRASEIFESHRSAVVQLRVIDLASGNKSSIGSGFQLGREGRVVSNYHVVSDYVNSPDRYRLEFLDATGRRGALTLIDVDVVNDLALLWTATPVAGVLELGNSALAQGQRVFSLGNPFDLAMTIVESTYNGLVASSRQPRILLAGTLNPGMSGGPSLNAAGEVIGINVAHGAEQISFLVPVEQLKALMAQPPHDESDGFDQRITAALLADQDHYFRDLVKGRWQVKRFGNFMLPWRLSDTLNCWGGSSPESRSPYRHVYQQCESEYGIYLDHNFETGRLRYNYAWLESKDLSQMRFYSLMERHLRHPEQFHYVDNERIEPFKCRQGFLALADLEWRMSWCAREYKRYRGLHDLSVILATTNLERRGLVVSVSANGVTLESAKRFLRRFLGAFTWLN